MDPVDRATVLELRNGALCVRHWPPALRAPFGLAPDGDTLVGPGRLRHAVRAALASAAARVDDRIGPGPLEPMDAPRAPEPLPAAFAAFRANEHRGVIVGLREAHRVDVVLAAIRERLVPALVVVRDSAAASSWQRVLRGHGVDDRAVRAAAVVTTSSDATRTMHWRARRHDLLVVDRPEQQPAGHVAAILDASPALARLAFVDSPGPDLLRWSAALGTVLAIETTAATPPRIALHLPLATTERAIHDAAWHEFLRGYDAFVALQPNAGFGTFVQRARGDPAWRDSLLAWHRALHAASWNAAKATACATLLARHRGERILVFTPDRHAAYELARSHLIAPVTAELPQRERDATFAAFADGRVLTLAGPRLLDLGVPEGSADVGILVGGGFGSTQHAARCRRIRAGGVVYELVASDTVEVGRAQRFGRSLARTTAAADGDGR